MSKLAKPAALIAVFTIVASLFTGVVAIETQTAELASANSGNVGSEGNVSPEQLFKNLVSTSVDDGGLGDESTGGGGALDPGNGGGNATGVAVTKVVVKYCVPSVQRPDGSCNLTFDTIDRQYPQNLSGDMRSTREVRVNNQLASFSTALINFKSRLLNCPNYSQVCGGGTVTVADIDTCTFTIPNNNLVTNPISASQITNYRNTYNRFIAGGGMTGGNVTQVMTQYYNARNAFTASVRGWSLRATSQITLNHTDCSGVRVNQLSHISWDGRIWGTTASQASISLLCPVLTDGRQFPYPIAVRGTYRKSSGAHNTNNLGIANTGNHDGLLSGQGNISPGYVIYRSSSSTTSPSGVRTYRGEVWSLYSTDMACIYVPDRPDAPKPPRVSYTYTATCFWDPQWSGAHSTNLAAIQNGGNPVAAELIPGRSVRTTGPNIGAVSARTMENVVNAQRYSYAGLRSNLAGPYNLFNSRGVDCFNSVNDNARLTMEDYGYYRLTGAYNTRTITIRFDFWSTHFTGGRVVMVPDSFTATQSPVSVVDVHQYGIYACDFDNGSGSPFGKWDTYNELQQNGRGYTFNYSACPNVTPPICVISDSPVVSSAVGNIRSNSGVASHLNGIGYNIPNSDGMIVMRDGTKYDMLLPSVNVQTDPSTVRGSGPGGAVVDNDLMYRVNVGQDVSPYNKEVGVNHSQQYFRMFKADGRTQELFNTWLPNPNANRNKYIAWYWSTDTETEGWGANYNVRLHNVDFYVPVIDYSNSTVVRHEWRVDDYDCFFVSSDATNVNLGRDAGFGGIKVVRSVNEQK